MASAFGHIAASAALGAAFFPKQFRTATFVVAGFCAAIPDADVLAFRWDIPYDSIWGHRGWTHSLCFAGVFGFLLALLFFRADRYFWKTALFFALATASHPLLDMLTNGGRGCALFFPFSEARLFFPLRPILVSPLSAADFFSAWGVAVLGSELVWIGLPGLLLVWVARWARA